LKVIGNYYNSHEVNDNLPIPKKLNHYFVELGDDDEYILDHDTIKALGDIMKLLYFLSPISNTKEKIIVEIRTKRNCQESIKKYDRIIKDKYGQIKCGLAAFASEVVPASLIPTADYLVLEGLAAAGITALGPITIVVGAASIITYGITSYAINKKFNETDWYHTIDNNHLNEDYITYDEETYVYHDGTTESKRINIQNFTRIISK